MSRPFFRLLAILFSVLLSISGARAAEEDVMIILDASGSMWGRIDGKPKISIAREVMSKVLDDLDGKANIGVMTYGHRRKGDCGDIETVIPVGKVNYRNYMSVINKISPKGKTPIAGAVRKAAEELRFTEEKATIVLVSDGLETCEANICSLAGELENLGVDFKVHVIGFDLKGKDTSSLQCLAKKTGGKYLAADNADELGSAFGTVVAQAPEPEVAPIPQPEPVDLPTSLKVDVLLAPGSQPLERIYSYVIPEAANKDRSKAASKGPAYKIHKVKPGRYYVEVTYDNIIGSTEIEIKANQENRAEIILNAGLLSVKAVASEGGEPLTQAYIYVAEPLQQTDGKRKKVTAGNQRKIFTLPTGKYYVTATFEKASAGKEVEIIAGRKTDTIIVLASGLLQVTVLEQEGGKPQTSGVYVYIYENEKQTDGRRNRITGANPRKQFSLPAGKYYIVAQLGKAKIGKQVEVRAGELTQTSVVLGVGAFKAVVIPAEGAKPLAKAYVNIFEKDKNLDGSRKRITGANQRTTFKLPAGKYYVVASIDSVKMAQDIEVRAGKRTEATININAGALLIEAAKKVFVTIYSADKNLDGTRDRIATIRPDKTTLLPAGKYILVGKEGSKTAEAEVEIKAGKLSEVSLKP